MRHTDTRVVHGARCTWWDGIEKVASRDGIPCCPHCKNVLFEFPTPEAWWSRVADFEGQGHAGYRTFVEWLKGKCFPGMKEALAAYEAKPSRRIENMEAYR